MESSAVVALLSAIVLKASVRTITRLALLCTCLLSSGCASQAITMPRPLLEPIDTSANLATDLHLVYATDRKAEPDTDVHGSRLIKSKRYGHDRDDALGYGVVRLNYSVAKYQMNASITPEVVERREIGRYPPSPYPFSLVNGAVKLENSINSTLSDNRTRFGNLIRSRLTQNDSHEVVVLVHGFNNGFDLAASTLAAIWHQSGRFAVPILYSWPASAGGLRGYFIDRESGEFTIFHFKEFLRTLVNIPEIDGIHIIAHSRGTDVVTSGLRELLIEAQGTGLNVRKRFRIRNLVLAAPDLDFGVMRQRLMAEAFATVADHITIYTANTDKALGLSQFLMRGIRFGLLGPSNIVNNERTIFKSVGNVNFIRVERTLGFISHAYYYRDPAVSADIIRLLRDGSPAGSSQRPLIYDRDNFYTLPDNYLRSPAI